MNKPKEFPTVQPLVKPLSNEERLAMAKKLSCSVKGMTRKARRHLLSIMRKKGKF